MPNVEIEMLISRNTTKGFKGGGEKVELPQKEAERYIALEQAKYPDATITVDVNGTMRIESISVEGNGLSETIAEDD